MKFGWKAMRSQQLLLEPLIPKHLHYLCQEVIVIHHITETPEMLQLEIERNCKRCGRTFERIIL